MSELKLAGCRSRPLAAYLKALGVLRLVAEQVEPETRGFWRDGVFVLSSPLDEPELLDFFLRDYSPTPLVSPWNGGSGFYPGDNMAGIDAIAESDDRRLRGYREVIAQIRAWPEFVGQARGKQAGDKNLLLRRCRARLPEACLSWLDTAFALGEDKAHFAPLLGTGGNEGRLEYANNFMQRVALLFTGEPPERRAAWLEAALFDKPAPDMPEGAVGQFDPGNAGGVNQGRGATFKDVRNNPWDFVLMLEGTLLFAAALARRSPSEFGGIAAPFSTGARPALAAGFASAALQDKSRGELWLPLWPRPASLRELGRLFGEGRATLRTASGGTQARDGMDFARAAATLGVDRGIVGFERYAFLERRGQSYVALPGGRIPVTYSSEAELLTPVAEYLKCPLQPGKEMPESLNRARRKLERALFSCFQSPDNRNFIAVSRALAELDALPTLPGLLRRPCPALKPGWIAACGDGPELRLAAALASLDGDGELGPMRAHLAPVNPRQPWLWNKDSGQYVDFRGNTRELPGRILSRRLMEAERLSADPWRRARLALDPADLLPLVDGGIDWPLLGDLLRTFSLVRFTGDSLNPWPKPLREGRLPHALALVKLLYVSWPKNLRCELDPAKLRQESRTVMLARAGRLAEACGLVVGRLRVAGARKLFLPVSTETAVRGLRTPEILACLLVPVRLPPLLGKHLNLEFELTQTKEPS